MLVSNMIISQCTIDFLLEKAIWLFDKVNISTEVAFNIFDWLFFYFYKEFCCLKMAST